MAPACSQATDNLSATIEQSAATVRCQIADEVKVPVENSQLVQVFQNLIGNGIKYRREGRPPFIEAAVQAQEQQWLFWLKDNGIGIERRYLDRIFEPFQRLHGMEIPGTGIGLAICKRTIERAGGTLWVDSRFGEGSTFYFLLPKA